MFKFGVEYTFCPLPKTGSASSETARAIAKKIGGAWYASTDGDCLEIPSKPMTNIRQHTAWAEKLFKEAHKAGYRARIIERTRQGPVYHGTGGGHIHVELPAEASPFMHVSGRMIEFFNYRPFIGWFFNEFCDDDNAVHFATDSRDVMTALNAARKELRTVVGKFNSHEQRRRRLANRFYNESRIGWSDTVIRFNTPGRSQNRNYNLPRTMEMRFFDAPRSVKQSFEHIAFAKAIYQLCASGRRLPRVEFNWSLRNKRRIAQDGKNTKRTIREFKLMIEQLGLDWKVYRKYVRNYLDRVTSGVLN